MTKIAQHFIAQCNNPYVEVDFVKYNCGAKDAAVADLLWRYRGTWLSNTQLITGAATTFRQLKKHIKVCREIFDNHGYDLVATITGKYRLIEKKQ